MRQLASVAAILVALVCAGCSSTGEARSSGEHLYDPDLSHHPTTYGTLGPGYPDPRDPPAPEGTFTPSPGSWTGVRPPPHYRVELVAAAHDPEAAVTMASVRSWAEAGSVDLDVIEVATAGNALADLTHAMKARPDLVVTAGDSLVSAVALVSASATDIRFLVIGGETAEPTANVTAVDWAGAGFRAEGLGQSPTHDPSTFTPDRTGRAIRAGVAAVLTNWSGFVVWVS